MNHSTAVKMNKTSKEQNERERERIDAKTGAWELEKATIAERVKKAGSGPIQLDVGGVTMTVDHSLLTSAKDSALESLFSGRHEEELKKQDNGSYFIDRNGKIFEAMIDYLRSDRKVFPTYSELHDQQLFEEEINYWQIPTNEKEIEEKRIRVKFDEQLIEFLDTEPVKANPKARDVWFKLGPLSLVDLV